MTSEFLRSLDVIGHETPVLAEFLAAWDADPAPFVHGPETKPLRLVEVACHAREPLFQRCALEHVRTRRNPHISGTDLIG